nr:T9SS type A sorting domain-containing protein [Candidatus Cloacimonadota bacterium]
LKSGSVVCTLSSSVSASAGTYNWTIPTSLTAGTDYKIRITSLSNPSVYDESDNYFTISNPSSITVTSPNGGENWLAGSTHTINWTASGVSGNVRIELLDGSSVVSTPSSSVSASAGSHNWTIPQFLPVGSNYFIKISDVSDPFVSDTSDGSFSITWVANNDPGQTPAATELLGNHPNPFNPETTIRYALHESAPVRIVIYDARGHLVKTLVDDTRQAGYHSVVWSGSDEFGATAGSGIYYVHLMCGLSNQVMKISMIK